MMVSKNHAGRGRIVDGLRGRNKVVNVDGSFSIIGDRREDRCRSEV